MIGMADIYIKEISRVELRGVYIPVLRSEFE